MTDRANASSSRDFAVPVSDHAGGAPQQHPQQPYGRYDAEQSTNRSGASIPLQAPAQDQSLRYHQDFSAAPQQQAFGPLSGYHLGPATPLGWDWTNGLDFSDFTGQYEPQGELVQELQNQPVPTNDFSMPLPVGSIASPFQGSQQPQVTTPTPFNTQNPLSPPPKPPQRPVVQTGMKRKAESEPGSAVSQNASVSTETQQSQPKRQNKSRQSSESSLTSPIVPALAETRQSPVTQVVVAQTSAESIPKSNTETEKKKEQSKGTGPQGRVIDVSKPRRVVESTNGPDMLPAGKVFPIQIGSELFRLSGASISSDGKHSPTYTTTRSID
jgi:hypothetical protein